MDLSIIVPLYNKEDSIEPLYEAIVQVLRQLEHSFEIIFVDDGSVDSTFVRAKQLAQRDPRLRVVKFRKNYGQTPAIVAGIDNARGRLLITMDGDLQNDLADIPRLIVKINDGNDIVVGWRHQRQDKLITRRIPSWPSSSVASTVRFRLPKHGVSLPLARPHRLKCLQNGFSGK